MNKDLKTISDHHEKMMDMITDEIMSQCSQCGGTGKLTVANGQDDYDVEPCDCKTT